MEATGKEQTRQALFQAGSRPVLLLIGADTEAEAWQCELPPNAELAWGGTPVEDLVARLVQLGQKHRQAFMLERAHQVLGRLAEWVGGMDPTVPPTTVLNRVGELMMSAEGIVGAFGAMGGPESSRSLAPILSVGMPARPAPHQVRVALTRPGPRWHPLGSGEGADEALCVIPIGRAPLGLLSLRVSPPDALPTGAAESLGLLLGQGCAASLLVASTKERQVRLERGYLSRVRELRRLTSTVDRLSEVRDDFLAVLSHDLRSPLSIIQGNCQILAEGLVGEVNPRQVKTVATISRQSNRMTEMVEDLLDRFRAGSTPTPGNAELVALSDLAHQVRASHQDGLQQPGLVLEVDAPQPCTVLADPSVLRQVLGNLVDNAIKHSPEGGTITVAVYSMGTGVGVEVRDRGAGFPQEGPDLSGPVLPREHGMGLKLCQRMMRRAGGALEFANHPDGGAITRMSLPPVLDDTGELRVVVGSGDLDRLEDLTERLGVRWDVTGITHGESLLEQVRQSPPDLLVLDQKLQGHMTGTGLLELLKGDPELGSVPVLLLVPGGHPGLAEQGHALGALGILELPLDHQELEAQVGRSERHSTEAGAKFESGKHDPLTGLDTLGTQEDRISRLQAESREATLPLPGVVVDVVALKTINQQHGYAAGDQVILWLTSQLRKRTRPGQLLIRLSSDEFLLVAPRASLAAAESAGQDLVQLIREAHPRIGASRLRITIETRVVDLSTLESFEKLHYDETSPGESEKSSDGA